MYLDICLRLWSVLAQSPVAEATGAVTPGAGASPMVVTTAGEPTTASTLTWLQYLLMAFYLMVCVGLIASVLSQTSKNEGLGGMLGGGSTQSVFRGKKSFEEKLGTITNYLAVTFIVLSMMISLVMR